MKHSDLRNKFKFPAFLFTGRSAILWYYIGLMIPVVRICLISGFGPFSVVSCLLLPAGIYAVLLSLGSNPLKTLLWMLPFTLLSSFQEVLLDINKEGVISADMFLNVATTNFSEVNELLCGLLPALAWICVMYLVPFALAGAALKRCRPTDSGFRRVMKGGGWTAVVLGILFLTQASKGSEAFRPTRQLYPVNSVNNFFVALHRQDMVENYSKDSKGYTFGAVKKDTLGQREIYVLVVGESSRGMEWQLSGYPRPTNPRLSQRRGLIYFPKTLSESNTTHKSVPLLLSSINAEQFGDSINCVKSIVTAFKEAGFHTSFISAQKPNGSYISFFASEADTTIYLKGKLEDIHDGKMMSSFERELQKGRPKEMIVLHCYGSHYNYQDRYPDGKGVFLPDGPLKASPCERKKLVNAYDNTVVYTDKLLDGIISRLEKSDAISAMIYTSDHGENIYDDDRMLFLHASPSPNIYQLSVPFLVWLSDEYREAFPDKPLIMESNSGCLVSSSRSFFHTAIDIAGISTGTFKAAESVASCRYRPAQPLFLNDYNEGVPLRELFRHPNDIEGLEKIVE